MAAERGAALKFSQPTRRALDFLERWIAPLALGAAASLSQAPYSSWGALMCALPLAAWLARRAGRRPSPARAAAWLGWLFGFGYFFPGLLWVGEAFLVEAERFAWLMPFAVTLLPAGLALFWAAAFWAAERLARGDLSRVVALTALWPALEIARGYFFTGFPWGLFAYAWVEAPPAQAAAAIGSYGLTAATIAAGSAVFCLLLAVETRARGAFLAAGALAVPLAVASAYGVVRLDAAATEQGATKIRLVQPNTPQAEKWAPEHRQRHFAVLMALSAGPGAGSPPNLVLWPETATPFPVAQDASLRRWVLERMPAGAALAFGALRVDPDGAGPGRQGVFNSLIVVGPAPQAPIVATYDKHHLVPFGEYLPFQETLEDLGVFQLAGGRGGFSAGPGPTVLAPPGLPRFSPLICYEAVFPRHGPTAADRPALLLQTTNDAWFGDSSGPWQHLAQARFRAIEQGLPLVRSANTGVSASVDPYGRLETSVPLGVRGVVDVTPAAPLPTTVYAHVGDAAAWLWILGLLSIIVSVKLRSRER